MATRPTAVNIGGVMQFTPVSVILERERQEAEARALEESSTPTVQNLVQHVRKHWRQARDAKREPADEMRRALLAKEGKYAPEKLAQLRAQGDSEIYMMLAATKARQLKALVADVILTSGSEKPWTVAPTPVPTLPDEDVAEIMKATVEVVAQAEMSGMPMQRDEVTQLLRDARDKAEARLSQVARQEAERAERSIDDLLTEGGFYEALDKFIDDLAFYKTAVIKGPVVRRKKVLKWVAGPEGRSVPTAEDALIPFWERCDPMKVYPAPWASCPQDGFLIEHHELTPSALEGMKGVEGYSDDAITAVMASWSAGQLGAWLDGDIERDLEQERELYRSERELIDALQYWGQVSGRMLAEWGMTDIDPADADKMFDAEVWLVDNWVIKAAINDDPLAKRPYHCDSFERRPGYFWGVSMYDTMRDCEDMCNAAARALATNMGLSSGPQVWVNVDRLPASEDVTSLYPWKVWQVSNSMDGSSAAPIGFFQPTSNANELMGVFNQFSTMADEYTGIPRYMTGLAGGDGGAGRTASGMSMMIGNAGKTVKKQVASIDTNIVAPVVESAHMFIMRFKPEVNLQGDISIVAKGALSLVTKESAQVRRNEFLQATANPFDMQIVGMPGRAALLRENAKSLGINPDDVVPPLSEVRLKERMAQMAQAAQMQAGGAPGQPGQPGQPQQPLPPAPVPDQTELQNGAPVTQSFG